MTPEDLRTLTLFEALDNSPEINQRQLAQELDISLGLTNTYLQKVLKKGWIRAKQVKARRWLYFLTPQGAVEKSRLSLSYLKRTLDSFKELKQKGDQKLLELAEQGVTGIHLCGDNDLMEVIAYCFSGTSLELKSTIPEAVFLEESQNEVQTKFPKLNTADRILVMSLDHQEQITKQFLKHGLSHSEHWELFV